LGLLALLTVLVTLGLHGGTVTPHWGQRSKVTDAEVAGALEAVVVILLLAVRARRRRATVALWWVTRLQTALNYVLGLVAVGLAVVIATLTVHLDLPGRPPGRAPTRPSVHPAGHLPQSIKPAATSNFALGDVLYLVAGALLVVAIAALAVRVARLSRRSVLAEPAPIVEEYEQTMAEAVHSGHRALLELDDARAAIIACYLAMEASLARAGTTREFAETPDELLARAARARSGTSSAARRLTELFYEARFSTHPLGAAQRDGAERALVELAIWLERPAVPVGRGGQP
jgi:hypothetical protein